MKPSINPKTRMMKVLRSLTAPIRVIPDFIIIGGNRCGTTTLYRLLCQHPCVAPAVRSEIHFFEGNFTKGVNWYRRHFPSIVYKYYATTLLQRKPFLTGEGTTYYLFHPHAPRRIRGTLPAVKLIALLRNPVDRAYSQYHQKVRKGYETLPFEEAIEREPERLSGELQKMLADEHYESFNYRHFSYLSKGVYVDQLQHWSKLFPAEQMLILRSEDLAQNPAGVLTQTIGFLGLPAWEPGEYRNYNYASYSGMDERIRARLAGYFQPHNRRLNEFLGRDFGWDE